MMIASLRASDIDGMRAMISADISRRNRCAAWPPQKKNYCITASRHGFNRTDYGWDGSCCTPASNQSCRPQICFYSFCTSTHTPSGHVPQQSRCANRAPTVRQAWQAAAPWSNVNSARASGCKSTAYDGGTWEGGGGEGGSGAGTSTRSRICLAVCLHCPYRTLSINFRRLLTSSAPAGRSCTNHGCACTCAPHPPPSLTNSCHNATVPRLPGVSPPLDPTKRCILQMRRFRCHVVDRECFSQGLWCCRYSAHAGAHKRHKGRTESIVPTQAGLLLHCRGLTWGTVRRWVGSAVRRPRRRSRHSSDTCAWPGPLVTAPHTPPAGPHPIETGAAA